MRGDRFLYIVGMMESGCLLGKRRVCHDVTKFARNLRKLRFLGEIRSFYAYV